MRRFLVGLVVLIGLVLPATAQERKIHLEVRQSQLGLLGTALGEMPYNKVAPLIQELDRQIAAQLSPPAPPKDQNPDTVPKKEAE